MLPLVSIVPRLPPSIDGVGDYALSLARRLDESYGIRTSFIVGDTTWKGDGGDSRFEVNRLDDRTTDSLLDALPRGRKATVLLHYGGYAYARRGCPLWLIEALRRWREGSDEHRLTTMFHELFASGPPWTSSFWLSPVQKRLTAQLARLSDESFTSLERYGELLRAMGGKPVICMPVFSSIGELTSTTPALSERDRRLVVFGTRGRRALVYQRSAAALARVCRELEINEVWDIGRRLDFEPGRMLNMRVVQSGEIRAQELCAVLTNSVAGVVDYPADMLGKSTIFAAYCAHRLIPLVAAYENSESADGLHAGVHYRVIQDGVLSLSAGQQIADNANHWYQSHNLDTHAQAIASRLLSGEVLPEEVLVGA